jgi:NAD(P)H-flavin reductase
LPAALTLATVHDLKALSGDVWQVLLKPIEAYPFEAGQYTELRIPGFDNLYFTIGSAPHMACVELHVQGGSETNDRLINHLRQQGSVELAAAAGNCVLSTLPAAQTPLMLIASGTGFSQVKSVVEDLLQRQDNRPLYIYWTSYRLSQLYMLDKAEQWADQYSQVHIAALISEQSRWDDKHQMLVQSIMADHADVGQCQALTCGSPEMVYNLLDTLTQHGFQANQMISDVFAFAPRAAQSEAATSPPQP